MNAFRSNIYPDSRIHTYMKKKPHITAIVGRSAGFATLAMAIAATSPLFASSHSDAPLIKLDPQANLTDVYGFIGTKSNSTEKVLNVLVSVHPFSEPGDGVIYDKFSDDALYSIHITNPATGAETLRYDFEFSDVNPTTAPGLKNPDTILSYGRGTEIGGIQTTGDARQNFTQTYTVRRNGAVVATGLKVPPPNVGLKATPLYNDANGRAVSGATTYTALDKYTREAIYPAGSATVFAGPREDGFYADTPGIFDLLDGRLIAGSTAGNVLGQAGGGVDGFKGFNVMTFAIQIPISELTTSTYTAAFANLGVTVANGSGGQNTGVGVFASVSRKRITLRRTNAEPLGVGEWIPVNRLGNPLFNEVLVALKDKDKYNRSAPINDAANFGNYATTPELPVLINAVFGTNFVTTGRGDLQLVFIPDVLRVDTTTAAVRLPGQVDFSRVGFVGSDTVSNGAGRVLSSGWPNGRRPGDDVIDVALTAVASGPTYANIVVLGDNVEKNDQLYHQVFPYLGTPHAGTTTSERQAPALPPVTAN